MYKRQVVEHVANFELFIKGCADLMGVNSAILIATLNRTPKSFAFGIVGAEYIMRWLPRGTHNWRKFIRPSELTSALRRNRVVTEEIAGLSFNPFTNTWRVNDDVSVNYVVFGRK